MGDYGLFESWLFGATELFLSDGLRLLLKNMAILIR